ncbi:hypothetical protein [Kaistia adipata]|uniref:DUF7940 domain-containing protein n=1 Tax=Kaistia adipata TaxID=166954 RepID=UPI0004048907|nr:hypothetical protein [Kaistia adipata]
MLVSNWRAVLCRAWSIRLLLLAGVLSGVEVALPLIGVEAIPPRVFATLSGIVAAAAFVARLLAQKGITDA